MGVGIPNFQVQDLETMASQLPQSKQRMNGLLDESEVHPGHGVDSLRHSMRTRKEPKQYKAVFSAIELPIEESDESLIASAAVKDADIMNHHKSMKEPTCQHFIEAMNKELTAHL